MKHTTIIAIVLTSLIIGATGSFWIINSRSQAQLSDKGFLQSRLQELETLQKGKEQTPQRLPIVRVQSAKLMEIADQRRFDGRLIEIQKTIVASEVSGLIRQMPVEVGDKVKKDASLIVDVDTTWLDIALIQAKRQNEFDRVNMELQRAELNRLERLTERQMGVVTQSDLEKQSALAEESVAKFKLSEAAVNEIQEKLDRTKIYPPFNGSIIKKCAELGAYVSPGSPLVEIVSDGQIDALFHIGENYIDKVQLGDKINVKICPLGETVEGTIQSIVPYGATAARSFPVRIRLDDKQGKLKVGMSVECILETTDKQEKLTVVQDAVLQKPGENTVWVAIPTDSPDVFKAIPVPVYVHAKANGFRAVRPATQQGLQQLKPGALTITEGAERLMPNQEVSIKELNPALLKDLPTAAGMQTFSHEKE